MSFDSASINDAVAKYGSVKRVVIAKVMGSSPRDVGASMLVWDGGQSGTIGGGALEYMATELPPGISKHPLGPELGQCCGGHVTLVTEEFTSMIHADAVFVRHIHGHNDQPLSITKAQRDIRNGTFSGELLLDHGWIIEPVSPPTQSLWIWGAGHVGRAVVDVFTDIPGFDITWVDTSADRFPAQIPDGVTCVPSVDLATLAQHAPPHAYHLIFTYSHTLDLALCHAMLTRGFTFCGIIGSQTKWTRFRKRLGELGHTPQDIDKITCPIGDKSLGKHPRIIAIGVAHSLLSGRNGAALSQAGEHERHIIKA